MFYDVVMTVGWFWVFIYGNELVDVLLIDEFIMWINGFVMVGVDVWCSRYDDNMCVL